MSLFENLKTSDDVQEEKDVVGGGGALDTGVYNTTIAMAYVKNFDSGALAIALHLKTEEGREVRQDLFVQSGDKKGNKNYYETRDGDRRYLPGFELMNSLCLLTVAKELSEMGTEEKVVALWNSESKSEQPTKVQVLTDLLDQPITAAIFKQTVDKTAKGDDGNYHPTGETRDENEIDKFFRARDGLTTVEIRAGVDEPSFINTWRDKWAGQTRDRTAKDIKGGAGGRAQSGAFGKSSDKPKESLFA